MQVNFSPYSQPGDLGKRSKGRISLKGYFHLCPRIEFLQTLHINNSLYANYENVFIELDS